MMRPRSLLVLVVVAASTLALPSPLVASGQRQPGVNASRPAVSAKPVTWTRLSTAHVTSLSQPAVLALSGGGIQTIWKQQDSGSASSIRSRIVAANGRAASPVLTVIKNWSADIADPKIITHGKERMVVFSGLRNAARPADPYNDGRMDYATSTTGKTWALGHGALTDTTSAYGSEGTAAIKDGPSVMVGVNAATTNVVTLHHGVSASRPASGADWTTKSKNFDCCAYDAGLGRDAKTGTIWTAWYSNSGVAKQNGILTERVSPKPVGKVVRAAGSSVRGSSLDPGQDVAVSGRSHGAGVWVAYKVGYPQVKRIRLMEFGTKHALTIKAPNALKIAMAPGPHGRLWIAWYDSANTMIRVAETNPSVTKVGPTTSIAPPSRKVGSTVWSLALAGASGPLHIVVNAQRGSSAAQIYSTLVR